MSLSKNDVPSPMPYPLQGDSAGGQEALAGVLAARYETESGAPSPDRPSLRATADLLDLVADHRRDLFETQLEALNKSEPTREHVEQLMDLVNACGLAEAPSPCAAALAISADLERLAAGSSQWTHPAQILKNPDSQALYKLCASKIERETGTAREHLEEILPRLERTARLMEKAASRRHQSATRQPKRLDRWL